MSLKALMDNWLDENDLKINEEFDVVGYPDKSPYRVLNTGWVVDKDGLISELVQLKLLDNMLMVEKKRDLFTAIKSQEVGYLVQEEGNIFYTGAPEQYSKEFEAGNLFLTKAGAEKENARRTLEAKLRAWKFENDPKLVAWPDTRHYIQAYREDSAWEPVSNYSIRYKGTSELRVDFTSREKVQKAIAMFEKELTDYYNMEG